MYMSKSSHIVEWCLMNKRTIFHSFKNQRKMFPDVCSRPLLGVLRRRRTSAVVVVSCSFWIAKSCLRQWTIQMTGGLFCRGFYALPPCTMCIPLIITISIIMVTSSGAILQWQWHHGRNVGVTVKHQRLVRLGDHGSFCLPGAVWRTEVPDSANMVLLARNVLRSKHVWGKGSHEDRSPQNLLVDKNEPIPTQSSYNVLSYTSSNIYWKSHYSCISVG